MIGMSLWRRLFRRSRPLRIDDFGSLSAMELRPGQTLEFAGSIEPIRTITDPISGEECVAIEYVAAQPNANIKTNDFSMTSGRTYVTCHQAMDFILLRNGKRIHIRVDRGRDIGEFHRELLDRQGVGLKAETEPICAGDRVRVIGVLSRIGGEGSPHRSSPDIAVITAQRIWRLVGER